MADFYFHACIIDARARDVQPQLYQFVTSATDNELSQQGVRTSVVNRIGQMSSLSASHRYKYLIVEKITLLFQW